MTRRQLFDWMRQYGCMMQPLKGSTSGRAVKVINPINDRYTYLDTPVDLSQVPPHAIESACIELGIPMPPEHMLL